jgi:hypothetical protein
MFQKLLNYVERIPAHDYKTFVLFLIAWVSVSGVLQLIKPLLKKLEARWGTDATKLTAALLGLLSFSVAVAANIVSTNPQTLGVVLGSHTAEVMAGAFLLYHFSLSDGYKRLVNVLKDIQTTLSTGKLPAGAFKPKS